MNRYDVIVIGGGHNGLTAATLLAKKGKKVLVVEKRDVPGGIASGEEFYPGYSTTGLLHDTSGVRRDVVKALQLERSGLKIVDERPEVKLLSKDGRSISIGANVDATMESIRRISPHDAQAYGKLRSFIGRVSGVIRDLTDNPPPKVELEHLTMAGIIALFRKGMKLKGLGNQTMLELLKVAPMSVSDFLDERFETDFLKAGLAAPALYGGYAGPWSAYSTINLLLWECSARAHVVGGPQALIDALQRAASTAMVEVRTGTEVERILINDKGSVRGVRLGGGQEIEAGIVAASCTPKATFLKLVDGLHIDYSLYYGIDKIRARGTTAKINLAINKTVTLNGEVAEFARTGNTFDEMEKAFDPVKYGEMTDEPFLDIHIPTVHNPQLAPAGHSVLSVLVHQIPYHLKAGWSDVAKDRLGNNVLNTLESYAPGIKDAVVHIETLSPHDLERRYSLTEGHIYHGEHFVDQLITRPIPACMHYRTPVPGLYLCGSGSHPGGGITCAPGSMAAAAILNNT